MATYLDSNATAPVRPEVVARMQELLAGPFNPSSTHSFGRDAKKHLEAARKTIAENISAFPDEIIFTGSATEANATALNTDKRILVSAIEHSSVLKYGAEKIPATADGTVDLAALEKTLAGAPALVSVMLANNETGVIQPVEEILALCKRNGATFHCDAVQGLGKIPVDCGKIGADMLTITGHKCGGPIGAAALIVRRGVVFKPLLLGGGQEGRRRAGTENVAAIAGFAKAVELINLAQMKSLRGWLDAMEKEMIAKGGAIFGQKASRLPNTTCVSMPNVSNEVQLMDFDLKGFAVSAGSACSSGRIEPSHVLLAMGVDQNAASTAIRISGGWATAKADIEAFTQAWKNLCIRLSKAA